METLEVLNQRLIDHYGIDTVNGLPMFRIVWANDQVEKRLVDTLDSGVKLLYPIVREVKKYPYLKNLYVLERLVIVPEINQDELPVSKLSYEPVWAYRDEHGKALPPIWIPTQFIVDTLYAALGKKSIRKYTEDVSPEALDKRITDICDELFGDENDITDAMAYGEAIVVPNNYNKGES